MNIEFKKEQMLKGLIVISVSWLALLINYGIYYLTNNLYVLWVNTKVFFNNAILNSVIICLHSIGGIIFYIKRYRNSKKVEYNSVHSQLIDSMIQDLLKKNTTCSMSYIVNTIRTVPEDEIKDSLEKLVKNKLLVKSGTKRKPVFELATP
ncbi:hypothetical protein [Polluticaenibacter yanchengensis]|uniref:Uncharacterized protein n=1 Tax=Polluticaenibacter yanchengensis TaxID=3014562 RepID=A0ABT4UIK9_9BACT|nr:hypothetical protein [Chitinophagaceae bacterium LY-5]